jgi:hypothetical protein
MRNHFLPRTALLFRLGAVWAFAFVLADVSPLGAAGPHHVKDHGEVFSPEAAAEAERAFALLRRQYLTNVVIEAYRKVPAYKLTNVQALDEASREAFFDKWAKDRTSAFGVYVLVCLEPAPARVRVTVGRRTQFDGAFTLRDAETLRTAIVEKFQEERPDEALRMAAAKVREAFRANKGEPIRLEFNWWERLSIVGVLAAAWMIALMVHWVGGGGKPSEPVASVSPLALGASMVGLPAAFCELLREPVQSVEKSETVSQDLARAAGDRQAEGGEGSVETDELSEDAADASNNPMTMPPGDQPYSLPPVRNVAAQAVLPSSTEILGGVVFDKSKRPNLHDE